MTISEIVAQVGTALHGRQWRRPLARDLGVSESALRHGTGGNPKRHPMPADHGIFRDMIDMIDARVAALSAQLTALKAARKTLAEWIEASKKKTPGGEPGVLGPLPREQ